MKKLTPSQQVFWEQLAGHQITRTGQPRKRYRSRAQSIRQGVWTEHDEWVYNRPNRLRDLLRQIGNKPAHTDTTADTGNALDMLEQIRQRHQAGHKPNITGIK
jgi:hypothetical protein